MLDICSRLATVAGKTILWWATISTLLSALRHALAGGSSERCFYLWGEAGSGKSHLLQACVRAALDAQRSASYAQGSVPQARRVVAVDDVERLDDAAQIGLFDLYNRMRDSGGMLLVSGTQSPLHLQLRDDLRTRLGWGLVYQVHGLSDEEKAQALDTACAHARASRCRRKSRNIYCATGAATCAA